MSVRRLIILSAVVAMGCALAGRAMADSIYDVITYNETTPGTTLDGYEVATSTQGQYPVVTAILSTPGTVTNGAGSLTYTNNSFLVNDGTGSMDVFGKMPSGSSFTPTLGAAVTVTGTYGPYNQIPEMATLTAITQQSTGNAVPGALLTTIPTINQTTLPYSVAGQLLTLQNVTISGASGTFGKTGITATITDGSGNSMTMYYWPTSYSTAFSNLGGKAIPTSPVTMTGFVDVYTNTTTGVSTPEFIPMTAPEPTTLIPALSGLGLAIGACIRRKVSK